MLTEDPFRRRELAALGINAEVASDGHTVVATFDRPQFDALVGFAGRPPSYDDCTECERSYEAGYREGKADKADEEEKATAS